MSVEKNASFANVEPLFWVLLELHTSVTEKAGVLRRENRLTSEVGSIIDRTIIQRHLFKYGEHMAVPRCIVGDAAALARLGADRVIAAAARAIAARGHFSLVLSGGSTPKALYKMLGDEPNCIDWSKVSLFFGDERNVSPEHADSNFKMANDSMISRVSIPANQVYRMKGESDAAQAASEYNELLQSKNIAAGALFDLVLLGMGADGHTASLFPETTALDEREKLVTSTWVEKLKTNRITMTPKALLASRSVVFLIGGADKVDTLQDVLEGEYKPRTYPSQLILCSSGPVEIYGDRAATAKLK